MSVQRLPKWLRVSLPSGDDYARTAGLMRELGLHTVCKEAKCPNAAACWARGTVTVMILGDTCTRHCRFCAVGSAKTGNAVDHDEPRRVAEALKRLGAKYAVVTSVTRDDLEDGGARQFVETARQIHAVQPPIAVELLIPDFGGRRDAWTTVAEAGADVYSHNVETVESLTPHVRDVRCSYRGSLHLLAFLSARGLVTKSSLMLGLGESDGEILASMQDLLDAGVRHLTLGQYLRPSPAHHPVNRYLSPKDFCDLERLAKNLGFQTVAAGPFVRSSYLAEDHVGRFLAERH